MDLEHTAIKRLQYASEISQQYYDAPLIVTYSGGKDSEVLLELARRAEIDFEVQHNHTTADAPETVRHIRETFRRLELEGIPCRINPPRYKGQPVSMWSLIPIKLMPPTLWSRYCCLVLKEAGGKNRCIATGVRWGESNKRANTRGIYEDFPSNKQNKVVLLYDDDEKAPILKACSIQAKTICNPIVDWGNKDIWEFARSEHLSMNPLYSCGFDRVGCIGCPMAGKHRAEEFRRYPKFEANYRRAFGHMLEVRKAAGKPTEWKIADDVFRWWMEDKNLDGQIPIEGWDV